jgi:hypothetical protein
MCTIPGLRGHDAQLLVSCQIRQTAELAAFEPAALQRQLQQQAQTTAGKRLLRDSAPPDLAEVQSWVAAARAQSAAAA